MNKNFKLNHILLGLVVFGLFAFAAPSAWANVVTNAGFETAGAGGATTANDWTSFSTGGGTIANRVTVAPGPIGAPFLTQGIASVQVNAFGGNTAGIFQNITGVTAGDHISCSVDARTPNLAGGAGDGFAIVRLEFFNAGGVQIGAYQSAQITTASTGAAFGTFTAQGIAPAGTNFARATLTTVLAAGGLGAGDVVFDNVRGAFTQNFTGAPKLFPISISTGINNVEAWPGKLITLSFNIQNTTAAAIPASEINLTIPFGLNIVRNTALLNGRLVIPEKSGPNHTFPIQGALAVGEIRPISMQILVTSGVTIGEVYDIVISARNPLTSIILSSATRIPIRIIPDGLFDSGTLLGKVFNDKNENGMQDEGEEGIPNVRLATEDGLVVYTDNHGKYNIPGLEPNRHLIKIDGHSLPEGTKFITEETFLFKTTPGMLSKVSFAVKLPKGQVPEQYQDELNVYAAQYQDKANPILNVGMNPLELKRGQGMFEINPVFHFDTNYGSFISDWKIEVRNEYGELVWTGYGEGSPPREVPWSGIGDNEKILEPGDYAYRMIVSDRDNFSDWTVLKYFRVIDKLTGEGQRFDQPFSDTGFFNVQKDGKQSIPLDKYGAPVQVRGTVGDERDVVINDRKVNVDSEGVFNELMYMPYGVNNVQVASVDREGSTVSYSKEVDVKDRYFFMVGLAEGELGFNVVEGSTETLGDSDEFQDSFYQDGRVAFYLKGKIKGRFLVTAHMDSDDSAEGDNLSRLFTNLDPDSYYPVYGDGSVIDYSAQDSQERFYLLIEADRSFFKYGSFETDFDETDLVQYNRTLSGVKAHYETLSTTKYGDAKAGVTMMSASARQAGDHNEFVGTGGSVYYLRHRLVIEGSEKLKVVVRDKVQGINITETELVEGQDYEIDYQAGRIILTKPLLSVASSQSIISNNILNGNRVILIADYEYETHAIFDFNSRGLRAWTNVGENLKFGGSYVRQTALSTADDYIVRGIDATLRIGENTKIVAEVAETSNTPGGAAVSFDGGLSFADNQTGAPTRSEAYSIKGQTRIGKRTELSAYFQKLTPGFAVSDLASQQGTLKYGVNVRYKITDHLHARFRHDQAEIVAPRISVVPQIFFDPEKRTTTMLQAVYARGPWDIIAEYRKQDIDVATPFRAVEDILDNERFENAVALKVAYQVYDWFKPYVRAQWALGGEDSNNQFGVGAEIKLPDNKTTARFEQMIGNIGDSVLIGVERELSENTRIYNNFSVVDRHNGQRSLLTSMGTSHILDDRSRIYTEKRYSDYASTGINQQDVFGYEIKLANKWAVNATYERSVIDELSIPDKRNTGSVTVAYDDGKRLKTATKAELRKDTTSNERYQITFQNSTTFKFNDDLTFKGRLNTSRTRSKSLQQTESYFTELNVGIAYRPIKFDRLNFISRYTYLDDKSPDRAFQNAIPFQQKSHTVAFEGAYEVNKYFQLVQKVALRSSKFALNTGQDSIVNRFLWASRVNFHVTRKWDISAEYRVLYQDSAADDRKHGFLFEVDRKLMDYMRLGIGYDFSNFDDGITPDSGYEFNGFYARLTGEF